MLSPAAAPTMPPTTAPAAMPTGPPTEPTVAPVTAPAAAPVPAPMEWSFLMSDMSLSLRIFRRVARRSRFCAGTAILRGSELIALERCRRDLFTQFVLQGEQLAGRAFGGRDETRARGAFVAEVGDAFAADEQLFASRGEMLDALQGEIHRLAGKLEHQARADAIGDAMLGRCVQRRLRRGAADQPRGRSE